MGHESCPFPDQDCELCSFFWLDGCVLCLKNEGETIIGMAHNNIDDNDIYSHIYFGGKDRNTERTKARNKRTASKTEAE